VNAAEDAFFLSGWSAVLMLGLLQGSPLSDHKMRGRGARGYFPTNSSKQ